MPRIPNPDMGFAWEWGYYSMANWASVQGGSANGVFPGRRVLRSGNKFFVHVEIIHRDSIRAISDEKPYQIIIVHHIEGSVGITARARISLVFSLPHRLSMSTPTFLSPV
jgi:hypothetical protein